MTEPKLWTKDFLIVSIANFFLYFTFYLLIATITVYATDRFHATPSMAGLASGIFVIGTLIARLFAGRSIDRVGRKNMLTIGFVALLAVTVLYFFVDRLAVLMLVRFLNGAALGLASTATGTIVAHIVPSERRGEGTGYYALSTTLAAAFGPFLGIMLTERAPFSANFVLCLSLLVISFGSTLFLKVEEPVPSAAATNGKADFSLRSFFEPKVFPIASIGLFAGLGYSSILSFLTPFAQEFSLSAFAKFFFLVYAVTILLTRPYTGRRFDRKGENSVMYAAFLLFAAGLFLLSQPFHGYMLLLAGVFVGLGYGTFSSGGQAIAIKMAPKDRMGLATSTFFIFLDAGVGIGPFLLGLAVPEIGYRGLYAAMGIVLLLCTLLYYPLHGKKAIQSRQEARQA
ncbi:MFS transporter [Gorillibacterium sp. sgz500922]|uniref:MFS transporter n=1 Tax=Gorillibacterium sp. sgz500922 TaxID=3446694 RepID=UPI003F66C514